MIEIEHLSHTADIRLRLQATTLKELFCAGFSVIRELLKPEFTRNPGQTKIIRQVDLDSLDQTTLFIDFLSDVLTLSYTEKAIFDEVTFRELSDITVKATIKGEKVDSFEEDIKAVTYHEADVHINEKGKWETLLILDI